MRGQILSLTRKMRQIDIFRKVIRHMLNSTVFPKPYTHIPTHTGISQRRAPQIKKIPCLNRSAGRRIESHDR
jgi:hypothetical protein